jgi:hypothetical protein
MNTPQRTLDRLKEFAAAGDNCATAVLHIFERLEKLEQWLTRGDFVQVPPTPEPAPVATDEELCCLWANRPKMPNSSAAALRAIYNLGRQHGAAQPTPAAESAADRVLVNCPETCWVEIRRIADGKVIYSNHRKGELTIPVGEPPAALPAPAGGLVERVANAIGDGSFGNWLPEARAAIREVAAWLDEQGMHGCSLWLREEAGR